MYIDLKINKNIIEKGSIKITNKNNLQLKIEKTKMDYTNTNYPIYNIKLYDENEIEENNLFITENNIVIINCNYTGKNKFNAIKYSKYNNINPITNILSYFEKILNINNFDNISIKIEIIDPNIILII